MLKTFGIILLLLISLCIKAQKEDIQFEHLSMKDGLSMNPVMSITQDAAGFIWFGTQDGLNRFDGYNFEVFKYSEKDSTTISDNFVTALCLDKEGDLWVGTLNGLNRYDQVSGKFQRYYSDKISLLNDKIYSLNFDDSGILWIGTESGVAVLDTKVNQLLETYSKFPNLAVLKKSTVLCVLKDSKKNFWFGTNSGLFLMNENSGEIISYTASGESNQSLSNNIVLSIYEDKKGQLWFGSLNGLNKYDHIKNSFTHFYFKQEEINTLTSTKKNNAIAGTNIYSIVNNYGGNTIRCMIEDLGGKLWIGTDMELIIFDPLTKDFLNYKKDLINPTGINDHFIRSIYMDKSLNMWIGTLGNGLNKTNLKNKKFKFFQKKMNNPYSLPENYVRSICEAPDHNIWVGTLIGGLALYKPQSDSFIHFSTYTNNRLTLGDQNVWALAYDKKTDCLWIGTNNGLNVFNTKNKTIKRYLHSESPGSISDNTIRGLFIDSKGVLWIGTENGLNKFNPKNETFESYNTGNSNISNNTVWKIVEDKFGYLWLATNNGLNKFDQLFKRFVTIKKEQKNGIAHNGVRTLFIDEENFLWIGTQNGLNKLNLSSMEMNTYQEKQGLPNSFIYAVAQDGAKHLWISTNKGVSEFDKIDHFKNYDVFDGLQDYEFNTNSCLGSSNGDIYFGGPSGLNRFNPQKLEYDHFMAPVVITQLKIIDSIYTQTNVSALKELDLSYDQNIIQISFAALDFTNVIRNNYMYKLEGFHTDWISCGNRHYISFTNLDPGEYKLMIKGSNSDGIWNDKACELIINIKPPFWKTWWFYGLCIAIVVASIILYMRYKTKKLIKEKEKLEYMVAKRTEEVEKQKEELTQINKDITDSITYAKRIQNALMLEEDELRAEFKDAFVFYRPRDIVSGDFYWFTNVTTSGENPIKLQIISAVDCTGHGVPGAFMSLIASDLFNQTIKDKTINSPGEMLQFLNKKLPLSLNKNNKVKINDGMDMAVLAIDPIKQKVFYAGANRPLWIINKSGEFTEYKATKHAVGGFTETDQEFKNNIIELKNGETMYMFSDGYVDQFGGEKNKKLGSKRFKELLIEIANDDLKTQHKKLVEFFDMWKGNNEQVDDILVIGLRI